MKDSGKDNYTEKEIAKIKTDIKFLKSAIYVFSFVIGALIIAVIELAIAIR